MKNNITFIMIIVPLLMVSLAFALSETNIQYPVTELGNCANKQECKMHCDNSNNFSTCFAFAKKYNLLSGPIGDEKEQNIKRMGEVMQEESGPGDCQGHQECRNYCDDATHIEECIAFAERNNLMDDRELEDAKRVRDALRSGAKMPGNCRNKEECEEYCFDSGDPNRMEECIVFGLAAGFMAPEEAEMVRKTGGQGPGGCRGKYECDAFCNNPSHMEECFKFGVEHGMVSEKEAEMFRKTGGKGPGDCRGEQECDEYCRIHEDECFKFATEHDLIPPEEKERVQEGVRQFQQALNEAPPKVLQCLKDAVGESVLNDIEAGNHSPSREIGDVMKKCFDEHFQYQNFEQQMGPPPELEKCKELTNKDEQQKCMQEFNMQGGREMGPPPTENYTYQESPELKKCLEKAEFDEKVQKQCYEQFAPKPQDFGPPPEEFNQQFKEEYDQRFQFDSSQGPGPESFKQFQKLIPSMQSGPSSSGGGGGYQPTPGGTSGSFEGASPQAAEPIYQQFGLPAMPEQAWQAGAPLPSTPPETLGERKQMMEERYDVQFPGAVQDDAEIKDYLYLPSLINVLLAPLQLLLF